MTNEQEFIGEIIEASTSEFTAESYLLHAPPRFGSFVKIPLDAEPLDAVSGVELPTQESEDDPFAFRSAEGTFSGDFDAAMSGREGRHHSTLPPAIYAVVYNASTTSTESGKQPRAYWKAEDELAREQPQLSEWLLMTKFQAAIIGYAANGSVRQYLPPLPPKIHTQVYECTNEDVARITARMDFLRTLVNSRNAPSDEVVAACIRESCRARNNDASFVIAAGKELASLLHDDYERLHAIIRRIVP